MPPRRKRNRGGRPRVRTGDEVQITVEFPKEDYAKLAGYIDYLKDVADHQGTPISQASKRLTLLELWKKSWNSLPPRVKKEIEGALHQCPEHSCSQRHNKERRYDQPAAILPREFLHPARCPGISSEPLAPPFFVRSCHRIDTSR